MDFTYSKFNRGEFMSAMHNAKQEAEISNFGQIEFNAHPTDERKEIATIQNDFISRLTPDQLEKIKAVK